MSPSVRRTIAFLLAALAIPQLAEAQLGRQKLPSQRLLGRYGLERLWWSQATINASRDTIRHIGIDEHNLYVQTTAGMVTCFDAESGSKLWAAQLGRRDLISQPLVSNDKMVLVAAGPVLYAVDKFTGESIWRLRLPGTPSSQPALDDDYVFVGTLDGSVFALDLRIIRRLFVDQRLPEWSAEAVAWRYQTGKRVITPPIPTGRVVNFASQDRSVYSIQKDNRRLVWQFETDEAVGAAMTFTGRYMYVPTRDFNFYCLDTENGAVRWEFVTGLPVNTPPRAIGEHVFLTPSRGGMYCLDAVSGTAVWPSPQPRVTKFIAATPEVVYASDKLGNFLLLDRGDGSVLGALPFRDFSVRLDNERTDRIYLATPTGLIVCLREEGREFPIFHKFPERKPLLPEFAPDGDADAAGN